MIPQEINKIVDACDIAIEYCDKYIKNGIIEFNSMKQSFILILHFASSLKSQPAPQGVEDWLDKEMQRAKDNQNDFQNGLHHYKTWVAALMHVKVNCPSLSHPPSDQAGVELKERLLVLINVFANSKGLFSHSQALHNLKVFIDINISGAGWQSSRNEGGEQYAIDDIWSIIWTMAQQMKSYEFKQHYIKQYELKIISPHEPLKEKGEQL